MSKGPNDSSLPPLDDPSKWATGGDPPTEKQIGFMQTLAQQTGENVNPEGMTKSEVSIKIDELKKEKDGGTGPAGDVKSTTTGSDKLPSDLPADETSPPKDSHLAHPENWATGQDPATSKQQGLIHVLARQHEVADPGPESMTKSEASEEIEKLKRA